MQTTSSRDYQFVSAASLNGDTVEIDMLEVRSSESDEELGTVEGFIVDSRSGELHFVVIDSGGWFGSKSYLLPPAHTRLDAQRRLLWADTTRETIRAFPDFDPADYPSLSEDELWQFEQRAIGAYGDDAAALAPTPDWDRHAWTHYGQPDWWRPTFGRPLGLGDVAPGDDFDRAQVRRANPPSGPENERAQPGDVLGIETGGETTSLGKTAEEEDREREAADKEFRDLKDRDAREQMTHGRR